MAFQPLLHDHKQQVCNERPPDLDLDGIGTFSIEVFKGKVLFYMLEKEFDFPSLVVYGDDFFGG